MKNPKYFVGAMVAILIVVSFILRSGENLGSDFQKVRLNTDSEMGLNMKSNTFDFARRPPAPPTAPKWGSFKSEPIQTATVEVPSDKNSELLKNLAKKVTDKIKDDKKKQKKVAKYKKKNGVTLIKTAESRVDRAMRRLDDGLSSRRPPVMPIAFVRVPPQNQQSPQNKENDDTRPLEEWQDLLLKRPNPGATNELIEQYSKNQLGKKEWVYTLAEQMLANPNEDIQKQGVKVLDLIPASQESYIILAENDNDTNGVQHSEAVKTGIKKDLSKYSLYQNLPILERTVRSNDPDLQIKAAQSIETSAQLNLAEASLQNGQVPGAPKGGTASPEVVHNRYTQTVALLETTSTKTKRADAKNAIDHAISVVSTMLQGGSDQPRVAFDN